MSTFRPFPELPEPPFHSRRPAIIVVDDFYTEPDTIREIALGAEYEADLRYFKGQRSKQKFLFPWVKEEFERLLRVRITDWLDQPANGSFQKTTADDPLVWHSDTQSYAAAIYLTPNAYGFHLQSGTSFWQDNKFLCRRPPSDPVAYSQVYREYNLTHPDNWNLIDRVGSVYNRLVLWDAQLIHSATSYKDSSETDPRLVQLFFFNVAS